MNLSDLKKAEEDVRRAQSILAGIDYAATAKIELLEEDGG